MVRNEYICVFLELYDRPAVAGDFLDVTGAGGDSLGEEELEVLEEVACDPKIGIRACIHDLRH